MKKSLRRGPTQLGHSINRWNMSALRRTWKRMKREGEPCNPCDIIGVSFIIIS